MKKTMFLVALAAAAAGPLASAQTVINTSRSLYIMPARYAKDGKALVYGSSYNETGKTVNFFVYDEDFQLKTEFTSLPETSFEYTTYRQSRKYTYKEVEISYFHQGDPLSEHIGYSAEMMLAYAQRYYPDAKIVTLLNGVQAVVSSDNFFEKEAYGDKYPIYAYTKNGSSWCITNIEYQGINWGPYGDWGDTYEDKGSRDIGVCDLNIISEEAADNEYYDLTNGIFGDGLAYIKCKGKTENYSREEKDEDGFVVSKSWGERIVTVGWEIYDDKNTMITSFDMPSGYNAGDYGDLTFYRLGDKKYVAAEAEDANGNNVMVIYKLDGSSLKVSQVAVTPAMRVSPNAPRRGETVKVTLGEPAAERCNVQVVSVSGQVMYKGTVPAGVSEIDVDTHGFAAGMYVVNVVNGSMKKEAAKLIVR